MHQNDPWLHQSGAIRSVLHHSEPESPPISRLFAAFVNMCVLFGAYGELGRKNAAVEQHRLAVFE